MSFPFVARINKHHDHLICHIKNMINQVVWKGLSRYENVVAVQDCFSQKQQVLKTLGGISTATLSRLVKENGFPVPKKLGNRLYYKTSSIFDWVSLKAGREVVVGDELLSSKQLEALFSRSATWVWYTFQKTARKELAIKLRSRLYWLKSDVLLDPELKLYFEVMGVEV